MKPLMHRISIQRDSVCAGDSVDAPHRAEFAVADWSLHTIVAAIRRERYLALIAGGEATWILCVEDDKGKPVAVISQQSIKPNYLVSATTMLTDLSKKSNPPAVYAQYRGQSDPNSVFDAFAAKSFLRGKLIRILFGGALAGLVSLILVLAGYL